MRTLSPFSQTFLSDFNNLFSDALGLFGQYPTQEEYQIFSTPEGWTIRTDLPGFEKSEIDLQFEDNALHLKAENPESSGSSRPTIEHRFALGDEVDQQNIKAKQIKSCLTNKRIKMKSIKPQITVALIAVNPPLKQVNLLK